MIRLVTRAFPQREWTDLVSGFQDLSLMQTWEYAEAKQQTASWKVERAIFIEEENVVGAVQVLVRRIPWIGGGLVWINRGPLWEKGQNENSSRLLEMIDGLRCYCVEEQHMYLRVAPPAREGQIDTARLEEMGYRLDRELPGWATSRVDLSQPLAALRGGLQQKWRNCLNKAERLEFTVESGSAESLFAGFLEEYRRMLQDRSFTTSVTPEMLSCLQRLLPPERKLWVLMARKANERLGGILLARYGRIAEYLAGAINDAGRCANVGQLLLWRGLCAIKDQGYRWFDLGGMDPERTPSGIFHFKAGLGGIPHRFLGEIEADNGGWINRIVRFRVQRMRRAVGV